MNTHFTKTSGVVMITDGNIQSLTHTLQRFRDQWAMLHLNAPLHLAWIFEKKSPLKPELKNLTSLGFSPECTFGIETTVPLRALNLVCSENFFQIVVFGAPQSAAALHTARRWMKPAQQALVSKGCEWKESTQDKLIVFLGET